MFAGNYKIKVGISMSRTRKGSKPPGYEFWSRRPGNKHGGGKGREFKTRTHRAERRGAVKVILAESSCEVSGDE